MMDITDVDIYHVNNYNQRLINIDHAYTQVINNENHNNILTVNFQQLLQQTVNITNKYD